jgi:hypothetical protein
MAEDARIAIQPSRAIESYADIAEILLDPTHIRIAANELAERDFKW